MAHFLFEKEENLSGKKAKVKVGQEGEQQQMNSDLKEYSRAICKKNNTVNISDIVLSRHKKTFEKEKANLFGKRPGGRAGDSR